MASKPSANQVQQVKVLPLNIEETLETIQNHEDFEDFNVHITEESQGATMPLKMMDVPATLTFSHSQKSLHAVGAGSSLVGGLSGPPKLVPAPSHEQMAQPLKNLTLATLADCAVRLQRYSSVDNTRAQRQHVPLRKSTIGPTTPRMHTTQDAASGWLPEQIQTTEPTQTAIQEDNRESADALVNALEFLKLCQTSSEEVCIVSDLDSEEEVTIEGGLQEYQFDEAVPNVKNSDLMVECLTLQQENKMDENQFYDEEVYQEDQLNQPCNQQPCVISYDHMYDTNRAVRRISSSDYQYFDSPTSPENEYELEYLGSNGLQLTSPGACEVLQDTAPPQLEVVIEEEPNPALTYSEDSDGDYDLSVTPYSSQQLGSSSRPLECSSEEQMRHYESQPQRPTSTSSNLYRSYVSDFNPQQEIHASWQDTIQEESYEDEELMSSGASSKKVRSILDIEFLNSDNINQESNMRPSKFNNFFKQSSVSSQSKIVLPKSSSSQKSNQSSKAKGKTQISNKKSSAKKQQYATPGLNLNPPSRSSVQSLTQNRKTVVSTNQTTALSHHSRSLTDSSLNIVYHQRTLSSGNKTTQKPTSSFKMTSAKGKKKPASLLTGLQTTSNNSNTAAIQKKRKMAKSLLEQTLMAPLEKQSGQYNSAPAKRANTVVQSFTAFGQPKKTKTTSVLGTKATVKTPRLIFSATSGHHKRASSTRLSKSTLLSDVDTLLSSIKTKKVTQGSKKLTSRPRRTSDSKLGSSPSELF